MGRGFDWSDVQQGVLLRVENGDDGMSITAVDAGQVEAEGPLIISTTMLVGLHQIRDNPEQGEQVRQWAENLLSMNTIDYDDVGSELFWDAFQRVIMTHRHDAKPEVVYVWLREGYE